MFAKICQHKIKTNEASLIIVSLQFSEDVAFSLYCLEYTYRRRLFRLYLPTEIVQIIPTDGDCLDDQHCAFSTDVSNAVLKFLFMTSSVVQSVLMSVLKTSLPLTLFPVASLSWSQLLQLMHPSSGSGGQYRMQARHSSSYTLQPPYKRLTK